MIVIPSTIHFLSFLPVTPCLFITKPTPLGQMRAKSAEKETNMLTTQQYVNMFHCLMDRF